MPASLTLEDLHLCIQCAFGWKAEPSRRYLFQLGELRFLRLEDGLDPTDERVRDAEFTTLESLSLKPGDAFRYVYDLAEFHSYEIVAEVVRESPWPEPRPRCLGGAGPPPGDPALPFDPAAVNHALDLHFASLEPEAGAGPGA